MIKLNPNLVASNKFISNILVTLSLVILVFSQVIGQDENMAVANGFYESKSYSKALNIYELLESQGENTVALHFNKANTYLKMDSLGKAILEYERALKINPNDKQVHNNLSYALEQVENRPTVLPEFFLINYWNKMVKSLTPNTWATISILIFIILLTFMALHWFTDRRFSLKHRIFLISILSTLLLSSILLGVSGRKNAIRNDMAIVLVTSVLKSGPDSRSNEIKKVHPGHKIQIIDKIEGWMKVRTENREEGWVLPDVYEIIK